MSGERRMVELEDDFWRQSRLWHDEALSPQLLGCGNCQDFMICGGLNVQSGIFDCNDFCRCTDKSVCDLVCRGNPKHFVERIREVDGLHLGNVPRVPVLNIPQLPSVIPYVDHGYSREYNFSAGAVAIPLCDLFHVGTGKMLVESHEELLERFKLSSGTLIVASGMDKDRKIEAWWKFAQVNHFAEKIRSLGIAFVTGPNFSLLSDVPRPDNFHSMKRIALCWAQLVQAGVPCALHVNARTNMDYGRWSEFIEERSEVNAISFEFATGCGFPSRIDWHTEQLCRLGQKSNRDLTLMVRGGVRVLPRLSECFSRVVVVETDSFTRTMKRRRAIATRNGQLRWALSPTSARAPLDELFDHVRAVSTLIGARSSSIASAS
jgi:hypothetical protein